jgi:hypothetical protein
MGVTISSRRLDEPPYASTQIADGQYRLETKAQVRFLDQATLRMTYV